MKCRLFLIPAIMALLTSCHTHVEDYYSKIKDLPADGKMISVTYPRNLTLFPPEINPPGFAWKDTLVGFQEWVVYFSDSAGNPLCSHKTGGPVYTPDTNTWSNLKKNMTGRKLQFVVIGIKKGWLRDKAAFSRVRFSISPDSVGAPVFCRAVPLPFSYAVKNVDEIEWFMGNVGDARPKKMLDNIPICANCHSFPANGSLLAMDVDYANDKGSYTISPIDDSCVIEKEDITTWCDYRKNDGENTFGLLSQISPDGRYVLSTVKDRSVFVAIDDNFAYSQLFFPVKGILACFDRMTRRYTALNGACDKGLVQSNPSWSPDGKEIIFARNIKYSSSKIDNSTNILLTLSDAQEFISGERDFKFSLYRLAFNSGLGGEAVPLEGASDNGKSNYFARYSPDGKWIVWCQANNFMLLQPDSKLYIMPAKGGTPRLMNCNTDHMNSWHSWSPNSKWIVFSSKNNGPYTQLYLSHIDENGNDSPPVLIENFLFNKMAANIPEFYTGKASDFSGITDAFSLSPVYCVRNANNRIKHKEYVKAYTSLKKALEMDRGCLDAYMTRIRLNDMLFQSGHKAYKNDKSKALSLFNDRIRKDPGNEQLILDRAGLYMLMDRYEDALAGARAVLKMNSRSYKALMIVCAILEKRKEREKSIAYYNDLLSLHPDNEEQVRCYLVFALQETGKESQAMEIMNDMIGKHPMEATLYVNRAFLSAETGKLDAGLADLEKAAILSNDDYNVFLKRRELFTYMNRTADAENELKKALAVLGKKLNENPDDLDLLFIRADLLLKKGDLNEALADYSSILKYLPENYKALKNIARIESANANWGNALNCYETLYKCYDPETEFYTNLAVIHARLNQNEKALHFFNEGARFDPDDTDLLYKRSIFYMTVNDRTAGCKELAKLSRLLEEKKGKGALNREEDELRKRIQADRDKCCGER